MKRKSREFSIFSMSALDLFASALGAFILIAVVIFPYFPNTGAVDQVELDDALERLREMAADNGELLQIHDELNLAVMGLRDELSACRNRADELESDLQEAWDRVHALERALEDQEALRNELSACRRETTTQQEQIAQQQEQVSSQQEQIESQQEQIAQQQQQIGEQEIRIADLERRKFMLVTISWDGVRGDDVDLHVIDPNGNEYYFARRTYPTSDARFEEDSLNGPGNEVWLQPQARPGEYRIYYNPYRLESTSVGVRGRVVHPLARHEFSQRRLTQGGQRQLIASVVVDNQGNITVNES